MKLTYSQLGKAGRLGNHLWQIASTIGVARTYGCEVEFPHWEYEPFFSLPPELFVDEPEGVESYTLLQHLPESERIHMQDIRLWWDIHEIIRDYFQPSVKTWEQLAEFDHVWANGYPQVSVHVRRDERVERYSASHPMPPLEYYANAFAYAEHEYFGYNPVFVVFSDDIAWCRETFPKRFAGRRFMFVDGYPRLQDEWGTENESQIRDHLDLFLMSFMDYHIIPNSTFSAWAAYLSMQPCFYPAVWYGPALAHVDWRLQIPPSELPWTEISW